MDWERIYFQILNPLLQITVLTVIIYWLFLSLEKISAAVKLRGLAIALSLIVFAALASHLAGLHALNWLLQNAISFSAIILAIVFQPELRRLFTRMGGFLGGPVTGDNVLIIEQLVSAAEYLAARRIGALVVIERNDRLDDYIAAQPMDAQITTKLLCTIFWKDSPLHDGALIISGGRIAGAGIILPLTENFEYKDLSGTRHRAGIGISEDTDALAILVSEETGIISVADRGKLIRDLNGDDVRILLGRIFGRSVREKPA
ncbi:MAG: TIGR00159 family protein [Planctomycetota bacterium]|nr:MAG: TIGR00159 family protein [Planctomycetota bacterium]